MGENSKTQETPSKGRRPLAAAWQVLCWMSSSFIKVACLLVCLMMISVLFLAGYQYLVNSPYIRLERVAITGVDDDIKRELLELSGLRSGVSLLEVNLRELRQNLERHPWVRSLDLEKRYPHTLVMKAHREEPRAVVSMDGLFYMNREGEMFKEVGVSEPVDYPVITGALENEEERKISLRLAAHILNVLEGCEEPWMREEIAEVHLQSGGNVSLYFRSLPAIVEVGARDLERKLDELSRVVDHLKETRQVQQVMGINLHYRDGAVVSFKKG
ncbi:MAG: cell division protein FtsQ/DivIB [Desulfobacteraceae bacterium]